MAGAGELRHKEAGNMLRLKSLGQTLIEADDARLTPAAETVFATALYLILEAGRRVERDELTRMLWPGVSEAQAQHGLRQVLYRLKSLGATIKADRSGLILAPRYCTTDFAPLLEPQTPTSLEAFADKIGGSFLPGYRPELSEEYATWVDRQRDIVHSAITRALVAGIQAKKRVSDWSGAEHLAAMCLTIDPLNEEATLTVAESAALGGSKTKALSILNHYLEDIGGNAGDIKLPAMLLRRRISEAYQDNIFPVRDAPFVGREEEMAELTRALARAQSGQGSAYVIWGEPGIGKTRLVSEFTRVASLQRVHIVRVACQSHDVRRPLSAFVDMVPKLLALPGALGCSPESMKYLRRLTASEKVDRVTEDTEANATRIFEHVRAAVLDLIDAVASECCLIVHLEDVQWLDQYSESVCTSISELSGNHRLMLVRTLAIDTHREESADRHVLSLHVKPLADPASNAIVEFSLSPHSSQSQSFKEWCVRAACGNPYFLSELAAHAKDDGKFLAPPSLSRLIDARLSSLTPLSQRVLQASCILGRHSSLKTIEKVLNERRIQLLDGLDELAARGFIEHQEDRVSSRHALVTHAALARASTASKAVMHRYAALALEEESLENATLLWDCAEHWRQAGEPSRAAYLMGDCSRHLLKIGLPLEAASVLETAAQLVTGEDQVTYFRECATAFAVAGAWEESRSYSERTIEAMNQTSASVEAMTEAELKLLVTAGRIQALTPQALGRLQEFVSSPRLPATHRFDAALLALMDADNTQNGDLAKSLYRAVQDIGAEWADVPQRDHFLLIYHTSFGDARDAIPAVERLVLHAKCNADLAKRATYFEHAGHAYATAGDVDKARDLYIKAFELARENYLYFRAECAANSLCGLALVQGNVSEAREWCEVCKEQSRRSKRESPYEEALSYEAEICIREGKLEDARALIAMLQPYARRLDSSRARARELALRAHLTLSSGESMIQRDCQEMLLHYPRVARAFRLDHYVAQLVRGLASVGRKVEAVEVFSNYVHHDRLSHAPLSIDLVEIERTELHLWSSKVVESVEDHVD
jgi:DNA-binding SARP family transcriptional activator/tetratricopeptide (TPR) repeat protein